MLDKLDNLNSQTRILLAVALALLFFVPYSYFYAPQPTDTNATKSTQISTQANAPNAPTQETTQTQNIDNATQSTTSTDIIATIDSKNFTYTIDNLGRISQATLKEERYKLDSKPLELFSTSLQNDPKPLEIRFSNQVLNQKAFNIPYTTSSAKLDITNDSKIITLTQNLGEIVVEKIITFYPNGYYEITINIPENYPYFISTGMRPSVENDAYVFKGVIVKNSDGTITTIEDGDQSEQSNFAKSTILAAVDRYYTTLLFDKNGMDSVILNNSKDNPMPFISINGSTKLQGYIGPKDYRLLQSIDPVLTDVVEYGIITFFAKPLFLLLEILYNLVGNWGWAIVLLTIIVRIVLYPLTYKGMVSMQKLKDLAPKLKEIQAKYKGDPQKLQMHMMDLYKKHGANPMGGCLPILLQMPVFFAIYRVLYNAIELKGAEWIFWINDLSVMDPYFILPILMGATMFLQQHLTPTAFSDPMQEKIFKFLPLIFTIFFVTFPSGLVLYWFVNNIFSILQQLVINKMLANKKEKEIAEHKH
ncbi:MULTISPECIES: membrane protein insertase YidC [Helicobacter]|uniref:Membrane protein insertase YidC n=1 Tax=Helicobacter ibis TaxID=2962633 RepID=A0ABT4VDZ9_9HELI|nr:MULTISPECIES: membrane protein insertase YidC [Helicobacter]MDA3966452.1 membrane protein insertase YidC [Helicobacter sp. WB40]MDA3968933.1 membrane protein insertase YidC [Helicobacter ibis]